MDAHSKRRIAGTIKQARHGGYDGRKENGMAYTNSEASRYNGKLPMKIILDQDICDALEEESQKTRISKSALVRMILAQWMEQKQRQEVDK